MEIAEIIGSPIIVASCEVNNFGAPYTILLVEDETFVRQATAAALRSCGYIVLTAADGLQALEVCGNCSQHLDLLLSDMVMPGMGGGALAEAFQVMHPRGRVLLMSGYAEELTPYTSLPDCWPYLRKPFSAGGLIEAVEEALNADALTFKTKAAKV